MATISQTRRERALRILEKHCGGNKTKMARDLGVTKQYVGSFLKPETSPGHKGIGNAMARRIEKQFGYQEGYLDNLILQSEVIGDESVVIPLLDVRASMGPGATMNTEEEVLQLIRLSKNWLRENIRGASASNLAIITGRGDSMSPTFEDGSTLLVDHSVNEIKVDGIYVLDRMGELFIKRIQRKLSGGFIMISDNPKFHPQEIAPDEYTHLRVLGKVLCEWTPRKV